jgi:hypothetical protein
LDSAPESYRALLRDEIGPGLRALGLKGSGRVYSLDDDVCWARLGLQASRHNSDQEVRFTINLCVVGREAWARARDAAPHLPEVPRVGVEYGRYAKLDFSQRLGWLMPGRQDRWWTVLSEGATGVGGEVLDAVRVYGLPALLAARARVEDARAEGAGAAT